MRGICTFGAFIVCYISSFVGLKNDMVQYSSDSPLVTWEHLWTNLVKEARMNEYRLSSQASTISMVSEYRRVHYESDGMLFFFS